MLPSGIVVYGGWGPQEKKVHGRFRFAGERAREREARGRVHGLVQGRAQGVRRVNQSITSAPQTTHPTVVRMTVLARGVKPETPTRSYIR